jgi:LPXTG-motif cell wall-anchored protein
VNSIGAEFFMSKTGQFERRYLLLAMRIAGDFGVTIAVPVVALSMLGKWLDRRYGSGPWLTVVGFVLAAGLTYLIIKRKTVRYAAEYDALVAEDRADRANRHPPTL